MNITGLSTMDTLNLNDEQNEPMRFANTNIIAYDPYNQDVCHDLNEWEWKIQNSFRWWLEGVGILLVGAFGIIFNIIAILVLLSKEMAGNRFNNLVICLAIVDNVFLLTSIVYHIGHAFDFQIQSSYIHQRIFAIVVYPWRGISMCCSTYITVVLALDRYWAVSNPSKYKSSLRTQIHPAITVIRSTLPIFILSIPFSVPKFFDLRVEELEEVVNEKLQNGTNSTSSHISYYIVGTELREDRKFVLWYVNVANSFITCFIPLTALTYLNGQLILKRKTFIQRQIQRRHSSFHGSEYRRYSVASLKSHKQQTVILQAIVIVFILCHSLRIVLNINEWVTMEDQIKARELRCPNYRFWSSLATPLSHLLLQINSGANFFIYFVLNETFLKVLKQKIANLINLKKDNLVFGKQILNQEVQREPPVMYRNRNQSVCIPLNGVGASNCEISFAEQLTTKTASETKLDEKNNDAGSPTDA